MCSRSTGTLFPVGTTRVSCLGNPPGADPFCSFNVTVNFAGPVVNEALVTLLSPKKIIVTLNGDHFGSSPTVIINAINSSDFINSTASGQILLKGKWKAMGIVHGDNTAQVINAGHASEKKHFTF